MSTVTDLESYQQFAEQQQAGYNAWSAEQAQKQMDFQERMSNTAHQREVADLKAAGLNPVLSANSGASVPSGAQAQGDNSVGSNVAGILQQVLSAQSAREVAGMYNAATIAAATISANASKYVADRNAETQREYPNSLWGTLNSILNGKSAIYGSDSLVGGLFTGLKNLIQNPKEAGIITGIKPTSNAYTQNAIKDLGTYMTSNMSVRDRMRVVLAYKLGDYNTLKRLLPSNFHWLCSKDYRSSVMKQLF